MDIYRKFWSLFVEEHGITNKKNCIHFPQQCSCNKMNGVTEQFAKLYFVSANRNFPHHIQFSLSN